MKKIWKISFSSLSLSFCLSFYAFASKKGYKAEGKKLSILFYAFKSYLSLPYLSIQLTFWRCTRARERAEGCNNLYNEYAKEKWASVWKRSSMKNRSLTLVLCCTTQQLEKVFFIIALSLARFPLKYIFSSLCCSKTPFPSSLILTLPNGFLPCAALAFVKAPLLHLFCSTVISGAGETREREKELITQVPFWKKKKKEGAFIESWKS